MNIELNPISGKTQIPFSKNKLTLLFIGSLAFVAIGIDFLTSPHKYAETATRQTSIYVIIIVGLAAVLFFGTCAIMIFYKFFDKNPGLIIDDQGIKINSGFKDYIEWADIERFDVKQIARTRLIIVFLKDPDVHIQKEKNIFKRKLMMWNYKTSGSPVSISSNGLKCNFDELYTFLTVRLNS